MELLGLSGKEIAQNEQAVSRRGEGETAKVSDERGDEASVGMITPPSGISAAERTTGKNGRGKAIAERAGLDDLIRAARACRATRDWQCAVDAYRQVIELYPGRPEAQTVLVPWAQIELDHLAMPEAALSRFRAYGQGAQAGPLAQEALYGECRALERLGRVEEAIRAAERFVDRYPTSVYAPRVESMLKTLKEGNR